MASSIDLHPPIHWGQTSSTVSLRIGLTDVKYPNVDINESSIKFRATGCSGSRGEQLYSFQIELYGKIDAQASSYKINDREIIISLKKQNTDENNRWARLTKTSTKLPWLKTDFDKMAYSEDESDHKPDKSIFNDYLNDNANDIYKSSPSKSRSTKPKGSLDLRTYWLIFYNLLQFVGYLLVYTRLFLYYILHGHWKNSYKIVENPIKLCQALTILEIIHPIIGFTKGDWTSPLIQYIARNFCLFIVINYNNEIQSSPVIGYLLLVWSFIELFRYPYYAIRLLKRENRIITWCRYTLWIVLYPLGAGLEGYIAYNSIDYYHSKRYFNIDLPNSMNFSFNFIRFLQFYLVLIPIGLVHMMIYMWNQRYKALKVKTK